jgi:hypothetical protein
MRLALLLVLLVATPTHAQQLYAAVLPSARSVQVGQPATAFATIVNAGTTIARGCSIAAPSGVVPAGFLYQTTDPSTNQVTGTPNTPVDIPADGAQTFIITLTPTSAVPTTVVQFSFACANTASAPVAAYVNTFTLTADTVQPPDIIAVAETATVTPTPPCPGCPAFFTVPAVNVGADAVVTVVATDVSGNATGRVCVGSDSFTVLNEVPPHCLPFADAVLQLTLKSGGRTTISVFPGPRPSGPFDPASDRIVLRFLTFGSQNFGSANPSLRGATSVAIRTQP